MLKDRNALIKKLERLYTLSDEKPHLKQLQTLSESQMGLVMGGTVTAAELEILQK